MYNLKYVSLNEEEKKEQGILEEIIKKVREIISEIKGTCKEDIKKVFEELEKMRSSDILERVNGIENKFKNLPEYKK